jgi:hypothetical protein
LVECVLGKVRVNFDAESAKHRLTKEELTKLLESGYKLSETLQASHPRALDDSLVLFELLDCYKHFGLNIVVGHPAYGCSGKFRCVIPFAKKASRFFERTKIGAEGEMNTKRALEMCKTFGFTFYALLSPKPLNTQNVKLALYTPFRADDSEEQARNVLSESLAGYLKRRGVTQDKLHCFALYGRVEKLARLANGNTIIVLHPCYRDYKDLAEQLEKLRPFFG